MKINYKILWIEDHFAEVEPFIEYLSSELNNLGFKLDVDKKETLNDDELFALSNKLSIYNPYDIIIFDYDLGDTTGDEIANNLRSKIFTDMIFYSGTKGGELRRILFEKEIDGVYIVNRTDFIDEAWPIIEDQVKRICDINNMRGVILDEMSKIDLEIRNLYKEQFDKLPEEEKNKELDRFKKRLLYKKKQIEKQILKLTTKSFLGDIKDSRKIDFNTVRLQLDRINNNELFDDNSELQMKQNLRNEFAHNAAEFDNENGTVSLAGYEEKYNFNKFTKIRRELISLYEEIKNT